MLNQFRDNIINIFGEKGNVWLNKLPSVVEELQSHWDLSGITPVNNMTCNYVAKAITKHKQDVIIKIGCDKQSIFEEKQALIYFDEQASIKLLDFNEKHNALLLHQARPGITLKEIYPINKEIVIDIYAATMHKLHDKLMMDKVDFLFIADWLNAIDKAPTNQMTHSLFQKAIHLKNELLLSSENRNVLHGDLHHDNILKNGEDWLVIDPKGIIGEPEFEAAAFDFIHQTELNSSQDISSLFTLRAEKLAQKAGLNVQRLKDWVFVRLILSAAWSIEDHGDPSLALNFAKKIFL